MIYFVLKTRSVRFLRGSKFLSRELEFVFATAGVRVVGKKLVADLSAGLFLFRVAPPPKTIIATATQRDEIMNPSCRLKDTKGNKYSTVQYCNWLFFVCQGNGDDCFSWTWRVGTVGWHLAYSTWSEEMGRLV